MSYYYVCNNNNLSNIILYSDREKKYTILIGLCHEVYTRIIIIGRHLYNNILSAISIDTTGIR